MAAEKIDALELGVNAKLSTENLDKLIDSLKKLSKELDKIGDKKPGQNLKDTGNNAEEAAQGVDKLTNSFVNQAVRVTAVIALFRKFSDVVSDSISKSLTYQKTLNMFSVSLGEYADNATKYGNAVHDALGIDIAGWQKAQGVFQTLIKGFGIGGDQAAYMSQNLTQLTYDLASYWDITNDEAANKVRAAISGRLEPIRKLGFDLSQSKLVDIAKNPKYYGQQTFYINEQTGAIEANTTAVDDNTQHKIVNFNQLTQQEKVQLRYIALMTQSTDVQNNYARALQDPANQLKVLKEQLEMTSRALGNIFIPMLNQALPYLTAFAQLAEEAFKAIAKWFGFEMPDMSNRMDISSVIDPYNDVVQATGRAAKNAKKLRDYTIGIDELNVLKKPDDTTGGGSGVSGQQSNLSNLLTPGYDFLSQAVKNSVENAKKDIQLLFDDIKKHPIKVPLEIFKTGAELLGENFWTAFLGKTPEELAQDAYDNGRTIGEQFIVAFAEKLGEIGSKFWELILGSPEKMAQDAEKAGKTVEETFAMSFLEKFTLAGLFSNMAKKIVVGNNNGSSKAHSSGGGSKSGGVKTGTGTVTTSNANLQMVIAPPKVSFGNTSADEARKQGEALAKAYSEGINSGKADANRAGMAIYNSGVTGSDNNGKGGQMFNNTAANEAYKYAMGLSSAKAKSNTYISGQTLASQGVNGSKALANDSNVGFNYAGQMSGKGYIGGLEKYKSKASSSGRIIAEAALKTLKQVLGIHSPSTEFGEAGLDSVLGYANWVKKYTYLASDAAENMANSAIKAVNTANETFNNNTSAPTTTNAGYGIGVANQGIMMNLASSIYQAVASGMANLVTDKGDTVVMIDGKEVFRVVQREERKSGVKISNGAFSTI